MFPAALAFIAETVGGISPRGHDSPSPVVSIADLAPDTRDGTTAAARPTALSEAADGEAIGTTAARRDKGGQDIPAAEDGLPVPTGISRMNMNAGPSSSLTETSRCGDGSPTGPCKVDAAESPTERHRRRRQSRSLRGTASLAGAIRGKCLVVCPTGAEASVIVCLAALVAFFPPPRAEASADDRRSTIADETGKRAALASTRGVCVSPLTASIARHPVAGCGGFGTEQKEAEVTARDCGRDDARVCAAVVASKDSPSAAEQSSTIALESFEPPPSTTNVSIKSAHDCSQPAVGNGSAGASNICEHGGKPALLALSAAASRYSGVAAATKSPCSSATADDAEEQEEFTFAGGRFSVSARGERGDDRVTKAEVRWWCLLLQQEYPWARPPRRLMQELNEYFMTPGEHSWWTLRDRLVDRVRYRETC